MLSQTLSLIDNPRAMRISMLDWIVSELMGFLRW